MSYTTKKASKGSSSSSSRLYPTAWTEWLWNDDHQCFYRWREKAPGEYDYDYNTSGQAQQQQEPADNNARQDPNVPRTVHPQSVGNFLTPAPLASSLPNYSYAPSNLADQFGSMQLGASSQHAQAGGYNIRTRDPRKTAEKFDPNYKVHAGWEFKWGRVFKMLWSEPAGNNGEGSSNQTGSVRQRHGKEQFEKVRRFVIVKADKGHCICLAIFTYNGQGVLKNGVHAAHHAMIYTGTEPPLALGEYEKGLTRQSIKMSYKDPRHKLDKMSRLNYAKLYTVEYNVKVWFVGNISKEWEPNLRWDYDQVHPPMLSASLSGALPPAGPEVFSHASGGADYNPHNSDEIPEEPEQEAGELQSGHGAEVDRDDLYSED